MSKSDVVLANSRHNLLKYRLGHFYATTTSKQWCLTCIVSHKICIVFVSNINVRRSNLVYTAVLLTEWKAAQPVLLEWWRRSINYWLVQFKGKSLPVLYSKLLSDLNTQLRRMLDFLQWKYTDFDIECAIKYQEGNFHRKPRKWTKIHSTVELFSIDLQKRINESQFEVMNLLKSKYHVEWE